jgi:YggT family protein
MYTFATFGQTLIWILITLLRIYGWVIIAAALISWMLLPPTNPIVRFLRFVTEPVLSPCRQMLFRILPVSWRRFDFSPVLALLLIQLLAALLGWFFHV